MPPSPPPTPLFRALRAGGRPLSSVGSILRSARLGGLRLPALPPAAPALPAPRAGAGAAAPAVAAAPPPAAAALAAGPAPPTAARVLDDLRRAGRVHAATLALMEGASEWRDYEAEVHFELTALRARYAPAPDAPATPARRAQMQAHLRAAQARVMDAHATRAARAFVAGLSAAQARALRAEVGRLDAPGVGAPLADAAAAAEAGSHAALRVSAEERKDALWQLSTSLAEGEKRGGGGGGGGGGAGGAR